MTKATHKKTRVDVIKQHKKAEKRQAGMGRQQASGVSAASAGTTSLVQSSQGGSAGSNTGNSLKISGDSMNGPLAFFRNSNTAIYPSSSNNNTLDISEETGAYTSHCIWFAGGSNTLEIISGGSFTGQLLFIESTASLTQTIKDRSNTSGGNTGNIKTLDGNDLALGTAKTLVLFMYSDIDTFWHQVSNPSGGSSLLASNNSWTGNNTWDTGTTPRFNTYLEIGLISSPSNPSGSIRLFADTDNSNHLTIRKSDGSEVDLETIASGANTALSNLAVTTTVNASLDPEVNDTRGLGTNTKRWASSYINDLYAETISGLTATSTLKCVGHFDPFDNATWDLGDATTYWKNLYIKGNIYFNEYTQNLLTGSYGMQYNVPSGDGHFFGVAGTQMFKIYQTSIQVESGTLIKADDEAEIGFQVTNDTINVGDEGTIQMPYNANSTEPSDATLDDWFGDKNGCMGIQFFNGTTHRLWFRSNDTWVKNFGT